MLLLALIGGASAAEDPDVSLWIDSELRGSELTIVPRVRGDRTALLRYEVMARKEGSAGVTSTRQAGTVRVGHDDAASLATLRLSIAPGDRYVIRATVYDDGRTVAEDTLVRSR